MKKYLKFIIVFLVFLGACGLWYFMWQRVEESLNTAEFEAQIRCFDANGAHYLRLDNAGLRVYVPESDGADKSLCGAELGTQALNVAAGTISAPAYALKDYAYTGEYVPVQILNISGKYYAYELIGFQSLDSTPSIGTVLEAYGITGADAIAEITRTDAETGESRKLTDADDLDAVYQQLAGLGEPMTDAQAAQAYYDAFIAEYGETEQIVIEEGEVQTLDDDTYQKAMTFWGRDMYTLDIRLQSGIMLRGCIFAPVPGICSVYGNFALPKQ